MKLSPRSRKTLTTVHVAGSVGLLGATASTLLLALAAAATADPEHAQSAYRLMSLQSAVFGIPLSFLSLLSGIALGLGTHWGVLKHWWVTGKLLLIVGVILNGALDIGPSVDALRDGGGAELQPVLAAALSVLMLVAATGLSVFKPGRRRRAQASVA
jgi:Predicted integral membrane protein (DUF2269)